MFLHLRSVVADHLPTGSPICSFGVTLAPKVLWVTSGNSPFVNLRSEHLFLRYAYRSGTISALLSARCFFYSRKSLFRSFVILTIALIYLKLLSFIVTYRQLYKKCYNSLKPRFQAVLTHKFFMRFASRQMIFECAESSADLSVAVQTV